MFGFDTDTVHRIRACFAQFPQIHKVLLYGSRAMGTQHPGSDVDITLIGKNLNRKNTLLPLSEALDELLLPVTFDCSIFTQLENPELIRHILERGVCFYVAKPRLRVEWEMKKLKDVCEKTRNIKWASHTGQSFKYIDLSSVSRDTLRVTDTESISSENAPSRAKKIIERGDVIYATTRPTLTRTTIINKIYDGQICSTGFAVIRGKKKAVSSKYVFYFFQIPEFYARMESLQRGASYPAVTEQDVKEAPIPVPPLPEQKAIVAILDQAFAAIDQAKAKLERNIANAKELFQSKLNAIFSQKGEGWVETTLKQVASKIGSGATPRGGQAAYKTSGIALIRSMNVHDEGFKPKNLAFIDDQQADKLSNVEIREDDILLNITGASVARCCVVDSSYLPARVNQHVSIIRLKEGQIDHDYLHYFLTSRSTKSALLEIGEQGATRQAITKVQIENFVISYPESLVIQREIVIALKKSEQSLKELGKIYNSKLRKFDELKKSLLQKAFTGALTDAQSFLA